MYTTSDFRRGLRIIYDGQPHVMTEFQHHKPGKGASIVRTKLRNLITGQTTAPTFRSGDKVPKPDLEDTTVQYLWNDGETYHFMDPSTSEQFEVSATVLDEAKNFLTDSLECEVLFYEGKAISIELPNHVVLEVSDCAPAVRGDTVQGASKPATFVTGHTCNVPLFINQGDNIRVDTRTGDYLERA